MLATNFIIRLSYMCTRSIGRQFISWPIKDADGCFYFSNQENSQENHNLACIWCGCQPFTSKLHNNSNKVANMLSLIVCG